MTFEPHFSLCFGVISVYVIILEPAFNTLLEGPVGDVSDSTCMKGNNFDTLYFCTIVIGL